MFDRTSTRKVLDHQAYCMAVDTEKKANKFELQFCSLCGPSFESEYELIKHLNISHSGAVTGGCCSSHEHEEH
ncbi:MAG: hypothetical protein ACRD3Z_05545 [Nitrososphaerales archaeon]